jgi:hypothetical protein
MNFWVKLTTGWVSFWSGFLNVAKRYLGWFRAP